MILKFKQDIEAQKRIGGKGLNTKEKTHCVEGTMTLNENKLFFIKCTNLDK
jgi:hypothetical protein